MISGRSDYNFGSLHLVAVENRPSNDGSQTTNLYSLTDELEWNTSNTTPSVNARKSRTYQPRQKAGSVQTIPETVIPFAENCNTQSLPRIIPTHHSSDGGSLGVVMPTHHPSDGGSLGVVMPTHHPSDAHSPPLVMGVHHPSEPGSPKDTPIEVNPIEVNPSEGRAAATAVDAGVEKIESEENKPDPCATLLEEAQSCSGETTFTGEDKCDVAAAAVVENAIDPETSKQLQVMVYDWRQRPWMENAVQFKPIVIQAVWRSNPDWYSLQGTSTPNLKKISDRLKKLDNQLKQLNSDALTAYTELQNYWTIAQAISNPQVEQAFTSAAATAKQQQTYAEYEAALNRHQTGGFFG